MTPICYDTNWLYSVSTTLTNINIGDYVTINPTTKQITIKAVSKLGAILASGIYPVTVKYTLISGDFTSFTFNLNIDLNNPVLT